MMLGVYGNDVVNSFIFKFKVLEHKVGDIDLVTQEDFRLEVEQLLVATSDQEAHLGRSHLQPSTPNR